MRVNRIARRHRYEHSFLVIAAATLLLALLPAAPAQATATDLRTAPYDAAFLLSDARAGAEVHACDSQVSGAVAGKVAAPQGDPVGGTRPWGACATGVKVTKVRSNGQKAITAVAKFAIESAAVKVPTGSRGFAGVVPCVRLSSSRYQSSDAWYQSDCAFDGDNSVRTPLMSPYPPSTGASDEARDEEWTHSHTIASPSPGMYEITAYLLVLTSNPDPTLEPVTAEVQGAVASVSAEYG